MTYDDPADHSAGPTRHCDRPRWCWRRFSLVFDKKLLQAFVRHEVHRRSDGVANLMKHISARPIRGSGKDFPLEAWHTHMQTKARPEAKSPALLDDLTRRFDGPFALVVMADGVVAPGGVLFRHQSRVLCRVLHQFERAC